MDPPVPRPAPVVPAASVSEEKRTAEPPRPAAPPPAPPPAAAHAPPTAHAPATRSGRRIGGIIALVVIIGLGVYWYLSSRGTISTDDAYVNGHVTFVAPRVGGQVLEVKVDDNNRVRKGDLLLRLDPEPFQAQVNIAQASVDSAGAEMVVAQAQARAQVAQARSLRFKLDHAIEDVGNQIALLKSKVAILQSAKATLAKGQADYDRAAPLLKTGGVTQEEFDLRRQSLDVAKARVEEALQGVYQIRVSLGLPPQPETGDDLSQVPPDLDQNFSTVRQAQASLIEAAAPLGVSDSLTKSPKQMIADFYKRDPNGDIDKIYEQLVRDAPIIKQAAAKLALAQRNLDQARLDLRYCSVYAEIDGVVTRREVNPGNNLAAGQQVMAVRSLTDIWIDANFKETQLAYLKIGQSADIEADMYGGKHHFKGRISGFTMGTGSTLALLPAQNATGNFVKVVQRLPVRIELLDYDPDKVPLFIGLSVSPHVNIHEPPSGPNSGAVLQPNLPQQPAAVPETRP